MKPTLPLKIGRFYKDSRGHIGKMCPNPDGVSSRNSLYCRGRIQLYFNPNCLTAPGTTTHIVEEIITDDHPLAELRAEHEARVRHIKELEDKKIC